MRAKLHAPGPAGRPLCNRQLVRQGTRVEESSYVQGTLGMDIAPEGEPVTCRHCLRAQGVLPKLTRQVFGELEDLLEESEDE